MIIKNTVKSPIIKLAYQMVSHKELQEIKSKYDPKTNVEKMKMWGQYFKHRTTTGFKQMTADIKQYWQLRAMESPTPLELSRIYRIKHDISKLGPVFFIYILPFSPILYIIFLKYFPDSLPSWFEVDEQFSLRQQEYNKKKVQAIKDLNIQQFDFYTADIPLLTKVAIGLTGKCIDGTYILNKMFPSQNFTFDTPPLNLWKKYLIKRQIKRSLKFDPYLHHIKDSHINEITKYKLQTI